MAQIGFEIADKFLVKALFHENVSLFSSDIGRHLDAVEALENYDGHYDQFWSTSALMLVKSELKILQALEHVELQQCPNPIIDQIDDDDELIDAIMRGERFSPQQVIQNLMFARKDKEQELALWDKLAQQEHARLYAEIATETIVTTSADGVSVETRTRKM
ncbi:hypothetical protein [Pseudoxanthomonas winnipegensis]|uniref:Uncharacterized protein n=1 Tax=Pseudoxanthomonas winnipegensis TaxID=2480810 RepID=A0A4Q8M3H1_9GAMM|nr:hypothetical protein [Pseudoxanthomonas winnipegensis]TAA41542.1 hypothetical protein EA655_11410 [Pseudoxanthomonas winnipegensis]